MKRLFFIIAVCVFVLCGCKKIDADKQAYAPTADTTAVESQQKEMQTDNMTEADQTREPDETSDSKTESEKEINEIDEPAEEPTKEIAVSPLAEEMFLEPFDDYSWEKEFDTEYIMLHFTSNVVNNSTDPYNMEEVYGIFEETKVSIHYVIDRQGKIYCLIPENRSAWHAGAGTYADDEKYTNKMNKYSIGIELLGIGSEKDMAEYLEPEEYNALDKSLIGFTDEQYVSLKELLADICERNLIEYSRERIIGHSEFNAQKSDPGELFQWNKLWE